MKRLLSLHTLLFLCSVVHLHGAERVALVIGNDAYQHARRLNTAVNDAAAVAEALGKLDFEVIKAADLGLEGMVEQIDKLKQAAVGAKAVMIYYAGHGIEAQGANYLIPVDAKLEREIQLKTQAVNLDDLLRELNGSNIPARMVILDCCRDNPLEGRAWLDTRSTGGGLGSLDADRLDEATLVVYAASPGKPALDRVTHSDANSPFTTALLAELPQPGIHSFEVFGRVEERVLKLTNARQKPRLFYNGSTLPFRNFTFAAAGKPENAPPIAVVENMPPAPAPNSVTEAPPTAPPVIPAAAAPMPPLPASGYYSLGGLLERSAYSGYSRYSQSHILKQVQSKLKASGHYLGTSDGIPGPGTQKAIISWQRAEKPNAVTGRLDTATLEGLGLGNIPEQAPPVVQDTPPALAGARPILYFFTASWSPPDQTMKRSVLPSARVRQLIGRYDYREIDVDSNSRLIGSFGVQGIPHFEIRTKSGRVLGKQVGAIDAAAFASFLEKGLSNAE